MNDFDEKGKNDISVKHDTKKEFNEVRRIERIQTLSAFFESF